MAATIEFKKSNGATHIFKMPFSAWSAGGKLFFTAKSQPDDDSTDAKAVIDVEFDDTSASNDGVTVTYTLNFTAADLQDVSFADGSDSQEYSGSFKFVPVTGDPIDFPADNKFIQTIVYPTLRNGVA